MARLYNLARMTVSGTPGTGTITLGSAVGGFNTFANAGVQDGDKVSYAINDGGSASETGIGTYTAAGTTLSRDVIYSSTSGGAAINASANAQISIEPLREDLMILAPVHHAIFKGI